MTIAQIELLKGYEEIFNKKLKFHIENFADKIITQKVSHSIDFCWIEILLLNEKFGKYLSFSISDGINVDGDHFYGLNFFVSKTDEIVFSVKRKPTPHEREIFSIKDYCTFKKLDYLIKDWFINISDFKEKIEIYFDYVISFLQITEIEEVIFTDKWIKIPLDMSPYK